MKSPNREENAYDDKDFLFFFFPEKNEKRKERRKEKKRKGRERGGRSPWEA